MALVLIHPYPDGEWADVRLQGILKTALSGVKVRVIRKMEELTPMNGERILFAVPLGDTGINLEYLKLLRFLRQHPQGLEGCTAGLIVDAASQLYTKSVASELVFAANQAGCAFLGRPLVEATISLSNFTIQAKNLHTDEMGAYHAAARELVMRLEGEVFPKKERPRLLVLHASNHSKSNTMALWSQLRQRLGTAFDYDEIGLRNGTLSDCSGCPYTMCLHFGERGGCFYGGVMQNEVYPALRRCDGVVMLCPNYNDAISANMTAFINRLTALFRQTRFYDKALFALVVSGYSGNDILARQLISGMNMNKSFYLPARFAMLETANVPGEAMAAPGIKERLDAFGKHILCTMRNVEKKENVNL